MKRIACMVLLISVCFLLCACGTDTEAPDSIIRESVSDQIRAEGLIEGNVKFTATHSPDSSNHTDTVKIKADVEGNYGTYTLSGTQTYQYSQSNDTWSVYRRGEWTEPAFTFNKKLVDSWKIKDGNDQYDIKIKSINGNNISMECTAEVECLLGDGKTCTLKASGTYPISGNYKNTEMKLVVEMDVPDGFYYTGDNRDKATLFVYLDINSGVNSAFIVNSIRAIG